MEDACECYSTQAGSLNQLFWFSFSFLFERNGIILVFTRFASSAGFGMYACQDRMDTHGTIHKHISIV